MRTVYSMKCVVCILLTFLVVSCSDNDEVSEQGTLPISARPSLTVIFSTNGLGDMTYNDDLLGGTMKFVNSHRDSLDIHIVAPRSVVQGELAFKQWMNDSKKLSHKKRLLVLASSEYETMLAKENISLSEGSTILLLETGREQWPDGVAGIDVRLYGISYLVGRLMTSLGRNRAVAVLAMPDDDKLAEGVNGLTDGMMEENPTSALTDVKYLSDNAEGYAMADSAFKMTAHIAQSKKYDWIYPLCGGSALGIYRNLDLKVSPSVIGMDSDCGNLCYFLPFSIVRNVGTILYESLEDWYQGKSLPMYKSFGLKDGYTVIKNNISHRQSHDWETMGEEFMEEAIKKEEAYEKKHITQ